MRDVNQIINEGKAMIEVQKKQIIRLKNGVEIRKMLHNHSVQEYEGMKQRLLESIADNKNKISAQEQQIQDLKDNNTDYLLKITSQHKELESLRSELKQDNIIIGNMEEELKSVTEKYNELIKVSTALVVIYFIAAVIVIGVVFFNY